MPNKLNFPIERGGLTGADREAICDLAEQGLRGFAIARRLRRHPATVLWYMYTTGLQRRTTPPTSRPYLRKGVLVRPYSGAEDAVLLERRKAGDETPAIAAAIKARFGHDRSVHSIKVRLVMLASYEAMQDESAPMATAA